MGSIEGKRLELTKTLLKTVTKKDRERWKKIDQKKKERKNVDE